MNGYKPREVAYVSEGRVEMLSVRGASPRAQRESKRRTLEPDDTPAWATRAPEADDLKEEVPVVFN